MPTERARDDPLRARACAASATAASRSPGVPFDERRGVIAERDGRVVDDDGEPLPALYCAGWIKRGPSGVIGTNKKDAAETVELAARGRRRRALLAAASAATSSELLDERGVDVVDYARLGGDRRARARRSASRTGRPRVKLCTLGRAARGGRARLTRG